MLSSKTIRIAKFAITVISAGLTLASKSVSSKQLEEIIARKVTEELNKRSI